MIIRIGTVKSLSVISSIFVILSLVSIDFLFSWECVLFSRIFVYCMILCWVRYEIMLTPDSVIFLRVFFSLSQVVIFIGFWIANCFFWWQVKYQFRSFVFNLVVLSITCIQESARQVGKQNWGFPSVVLSFLGFLLSRIWFLLISAFLFPSFTPSHP